MLAVIMLCVAFSWRYAECPYAERHYAECPYAECNDAISAAQCTKVDYYRAPIL
jgi:hypothetical protein